MTAPGEPVPERSISEIVYGKLNEGTEVTPEERARVKQALKDSPTGRLANAIRAAFPELPAEIEAETEDYDTTNDGRYTVRGEATGETRLAEGLNRGESWVARFVGEWIGNALREADARQLANEHNRQRQQEGQLG